MQLIGGRDNEVKSLDSKNLEQRVIIFSKENSVECGATDGFYMRVRQIM